ncbi:MAG: hypothetical protein ACLVHS_07975 [Blautia wexlerae]
MIYDSGRYDGKKKDMKKLPAEYEHELIERADLFLETDEEFLKRKEMNMKSCWMNTIRK